MRNRYEPPTDPAAWELHQTQSTGDPYRNSPAVTRPVPVMAEEQPGATRSAGLRRLSRLTWRATQLSAVTAVGFVTLFVRTAPVQTADQAAVALGTKPSTSASPAGTPTPSASQRHHKGGRAARGVQPTVQAGQAATPAAGRPSGSASSPSTSSSSSSTGGSGSHGSSSSPTLAPPSSAPAPAPPPGSAPAPPPTTSSGSHGGG